MTFAANVVRIMIASPSDVNEERAIVTEAIHKWNDANSYPRRLVLSPVKWETHTTPQLGEHPQSIINRQLLEEADLLIGIFGNRIGTPTAAYISGTVEEIKRHVAAGKTAKVYFSDVPVAPSALNLQQRESVQEFKQDCLSDGICGEYKSLEDFKDLFSHHLNIEMNQARYRWLTMDDGAITSSSDVSPDAMRLLVAAVEVDQDPLILQSSLQGSHLWIRDKDFMDGTRRSEAKWRRAVIELVTRRLLESESEDVYRITDEGYAAADRYIAEREEQKKADQLSAPALAILDSAAKNGGQITVLRHGGMDRINAGGRWMAENEATPKDLAMWTAGLEELDRREFVQKRSPSSFIVTHKGYKAAERASNDSQENLKLASS